MKERVKELCKVLEISRREFCRRIGKSEGWTNTMNENTTIGTVRNILHAFPQINIAWLIDGEGDMFVEKQGKMLNDEPIGYHVNNNYKDICEDLRADNKDLREENKRLRDTVLDLMHKNERLMIENAQLQAKSQKESKQEIL